jgi:hypothetical protein
MEYRRVRFTPGLAAEWLAGGSLRGPPNMITVRSYASLPERNAWIYNDSVPIMRCDDGRLLNSGSRLVAVVLANIPATLQVIDKIPLDVALAAVSRADVVMVKPLNLTE